MVIVKVIVTILSLFCCDEMTQAKVAYKRGLFLIMVLAGESIKAGRSDLVTEKEGGQSHLIHTGRTVKEEEEIRK